MKALTPTERQLLKGHAHRLNPVVLIGSGGLTPAVMKEIDAALKAHELIKIKASGAERENREAWLAQMCTELEAQPVQHIGKILVIYREVPKKERPKEKKSPEKPAKKRTPRKQSKGGPAL